MEVLNQNANINCGTCPLNDEVVFEADAVYYRCSKTGEYHIFNYSCGNIKLCYKEGEN